MGIFRGGSSSSDKYGHKFYSDDFIDFRKKARKASWDKWKAAVSAFVKRKKRMKMKSNGDLRRRMVDFVRGQGKFARHCFRFNFRLMRSQLGRPIIQPLSLHMPVRHAHPKWKRPQYEAFLDAEAIRNNVKKKGKTRQKKTS